MKTQFYSFVNNLLLLLQKYKILKYFLIQFLLILIFSCIYWSLGSPENFDFISDNKNLNLSYLDALYFTLATQTTVGYGDITPKSQKLRGIVIIQIILLISFIIYI